MAKKKYFSDDAMRRINDTVKRSEAVERAGKISRATRPAPQQRYWAKATEDIASETSGTVGIYASVRDMSGTPLRTMDIYNWGCDITEGDRMVVSCIGEDWVPDSLVRVVTE